MHLSMAPISSTASGYCCSKATFRLRPSILLFGDSITQFGFGSPPDTTHGWASLLSAAYTRRADVLNRGFSGYNTRHALDLVPRIFGPKVENDDDDDALGKRNDKELLFCTVFFGANDAALPGEGQHVPLDEYAKNIDQLVVQIRERSSAQLPIVLMTPPPVDEVKLTEWKGSANRENMNTRQYGLKLQKIAEKHDRVSVVDCWGLLKGDTDQRGDYVCDGLHLNELGNQKVFEGLMDTIHSTFPDLAPMSDEDGEGRYGRSGIPLEEKLWRELI